MAQFRVSTDADAVRELGRLTHRITAVTQATVAASEAAR